MVPKLFASGKSFKKLGLYLLHDPDKAKTAHRVRWTHTLNLASDHPASAVNEMLWTYRAAEELKRQAGIAPGGRQLENPVRHFSLNWHPSQTPTREHMIETVESFLAHMNWHERQGLIVCHEDKHPHVHVMLNSVHPETGKALDTSFEKRRAQEWALQYEREHELVFCEERLKPIEHRTPSPTREAWEQLRAYGREDDRVEHERVARALSYFERHDDKGIAPCEWDALKAHQREEREQFFIDGKEAYRQVRNAAYREVRAEFREEWKEYFDAKREGVDSERLAEMKADILSRQRETLDERRAAACAALRQERDEFYAALLAQHVEQRHELARRQENGERAHHLLDTLYPVQPGQTRGHTQDQEKLLDAERRAAHEICEPEAERSDRKVRQDAEREDREDQPAHELHRVRDPVDAIGGLGLGVIGGIATIAERLFDGFLGGAKAKAPPPQQQPKKEQLHSERPETIRAVQAQAETQARAGEKAKVDGWWEERRRRGRERD